MEYNTKREKLIIPEYGRNVQRMVDYALTIEDRERRTAYVNLIITAMYNVNPDAKNMVDFKHKLWDHLYIISDYKLDVDSPYPMPDKQERLSAPQALKCHYNNIKFGPYGCVIEKMIDKVISMEDSQEKETLIALIAQQLKKSYLQWNRDSVDDELILQHFEQLSKGQLHLSEDFKLNTTKNILNAGKTHKVIKNRPATKTKKTNQAKKRF